MLLGHTQHRADAFAAFFEAQQHPRRLRIAATGAGGQAEAAMPANHTRQTMFSHVNRRIPDQRSIGKHPHTAPMIGPFGQDGGQTRMTLRIGQQPHFRL